MKNITIYDWMISKCKLSGNELLVFAFMYETYERSCWYESFYFVQRLNKLMSRASIYRALDSLYQKKLICRGPSLCGHCFKYSTWITDFLDENERVSEELIRIAKTPWVKK